MKRGPHPLRDIIPLPEYPELLAAVYGDRIPTTRVAELLGVSRNTIYRHIRVGNIAMDGHRINTRSLALYLTTHEPQGTKIPPKPVKRKRGRPRKSEVINGAVGST